MIRKTLEVANVRCEGCASTIKTALAKEGFLDVAVDLTCEPRKVTLALQNEASVAQVREILRKLGYPLTGEIVGLADTVALKAKSFVSCAVGKINTNTNEGNFITKRGD